MHKTATPKKPAWLPRSCVVTHTVREFGYSMHSHAGAWEREKSDTTIGKNYLLEEDIKKLERAVSSFFDYIEGIIERRTSFTMESFAESVNKFLAFNEYKILEGYGKITRKQAEQKALSEYEKFNKIQKIESDFDKKTKAFLKAQKNKGEADE